MQPDIGRQRGVSLGALAALLLGLFALDNALLLAFLGIGKLWSALAAVAAISGIAQLIKKTPVAAVQIPWRAIAIAAIISLAIFLLGGEGRFFYANADWQIRDAILHDIARHHWPFAYAVDGKSLFLRAPLGLYLLPSLAGAAWADVALLLSNALRLTLLLSMCWPLFETSRQRAIALIIFLLFSGLDAAGNLLLTYGGVPVSWDHMEPWNDNYQFSSNMTLAFWVPNHALAGWACAVTYLLWQRGKASIALFAASIPLVAIWSPLAIMGAMPFALYAGVKSLVARQIARPDIAVAAAALLTALPALYYMQLDAAEVGSGMLHPGIVPYLFGVGLEVWPFILPPLLAAATPAGERQTLRIALVCLMLAPLYQIGEAADFQSRASIMPLALAAAGFAGWISRPLAKDKLVLGICALAIGAVTPMLETRRALMNGPSPEPRCSLIGAWQMQSGLIVSYASYLIDVRALSATIGTKTLAKVEKDPAKCWDRDWITIAPRQIMVR